jgi:hypothetical protein
LPLFTVLHAGRASLEAGTPRPFRASVGLLVSIPPHSYTHATVSETYFAALSIRLTNCRDTAVFCAVTRTCTCISCLLKGQRANDTTHSLFARLED